jgi:tRNA (cmo5U34)-methyltransferase
MTRSTASHLGISLRDYDVLIRTFIPRYEEMLDAAAAVLNGLPRRPLVVLDLGIGSGALASRAVAVRPRARVMGIDSDEEMLRMAGRRLGAHLTGIPGDFQVTAFPRCDVVMASLALHHIRRRRDKARLYARCAAALCPGGVFVNADCCLASTPRQQSLDRAAWMAHLGRRYSTARARRYFRDWAREDVYFRLEDEVALLGSAGFTVDVPWRRDSFAVVVGTKRGRRQI